MDWVEEKVLWFLGTFAALILGFVYGAGKLFQRVKNLEEQKDITHSRIDKVNEKLDRIDSHQSEMLGKLDILINNQNQ